MAADGHFAPQNVLLGTPKGATPAEPAPWLDFSLNCEVGKLYLTWCKITLGKF